MVFGICYSVFGIRYLLFGIRYSIVGIRNSGFGGITVGIPDSVRGCRSDEVSGFKVEFFADDAAFPCWEAKFHKI